MYKFIVLVCAVIMLTGCSDKQVQFAGYSKHWTVKGDFQIGDKHKNGSYTFIYKGKLTKPLKKVKFKIKEYGGGSENTYDRLKRKVTTVKQSCSGCAVSKIDPIKVEITWNKMNKETLVLTPQ